MLALNLSIRAPGQSFGQCMGANANTYSLGGAGELALDDLFNKNTSYSSTTLGKFAAGNSISSLLWGSAGDTAQTAATSTPSLVNAAMGSPLTYGRRTTDIFDLNLLGKGGVPQALSSGARDVKSFLGDLDNVLNLGMDATTKLGIDTAFTGAEAIGCGIPW